MLSQNQINKINNLWKQYPLIQEIYDDRIFGVSAGVFAKVS